MSTITQQQEKHQLVVGQMIIDSYKKMATDQNGRIIPLTEKEICIIKYLLDHKHQYITRDKLLEEIWHYNQHTETHTLETHIHRIRKKLPEINIECKNHCYTISSF